MTRRRIRPEDLDLWNKVTHTTTKLHPEKKKPTVLSPSVSGKPKPKVQPVPLKTNFKVGQSAPIRGPSFDVLGDISEQVRNTPIKMDNKTHGRLKRGKLKPEARLDLHGKTMAQAQPILSSFIMRAHADGKRLVLVITGKGKHRDEGGPIPVPFGVLRNNVPHWLSVPPLAQLVLQVSEAHLKHGGAGAYYVYLRRSR